MRFLFPLNLSSMSVLHPFYSSPTHPFSPPLCLPACDAGGAAPVDRRGDDAHHAVPRRTAQQPGTTPPLLPSLDYLKRPTLFTLHSLPSFYNLKRPLSSNPSSLPCLPTHRLSLYPQAKEGSQIVYIPEGGAVVVVNVLEDSPAMEGGLKTLDILLEIERRPIYKVGGTVPTDMVVQRR